MELSEFSLPLKSMYAQMSVKAIDENSCEISMSSDFIVKGGPLGWVIGRFIMKPVMKGVFKKLMSGLAYHTATGELIGEKLPVNEAMNKIVIN